VSDRLTATGRTRRGIRAALAVVALGASLLGCLSMGPTGPGDAPDGTTPVLFIGNSLTYWNDLPGMVAALGAADAAPIWARSVAIPDADLGIHLADGRAADAIASNRWKVVVLQQGPSSLPENRAALRSWTRTFAERIRAVGGRPALYAVWPQEIHQHTWDEATRSYALAASDVDGMLFPVGEAWRAAWRRDPAIALYSGDGLHPSVEGSYLAAIVIYATLAGRSPVGLPAELRVETGVVRIPAARAAVLQEAAREAIEEYGRP